MPPLRSAQRTGYDSRDLKIVGFPSVYGEQGDSLRPVNNLQEVRNGVAMKDKLLHFSGQFLKRDNEWIDES